MILLVSPEGSLPAQAFNAEQLVVVSYTQVGSSEYVYSLVFANEDSYNSGTVFTTAALAVAAAVSLLQSLPVVSILSTLNLVETITLT